MSFMDAASNATLLQMFQDADVIVQGVMLLLLTASVFSWSLIISRGVSIFVERRASAQVIKALGAVQNREDLVELAAGGEGRVSHVVSAVAEEWTWSQDNAGRDYAQTRQRLATVLELNIAREYQKLAGRTAWLATIGNSAPFVGLFGTVWGIMNSFIAISQAQETSLAVVAPGMAEALLATAVGLFCAIPASIGYNRLVQGLADVDQDWRAVGGQLEVAISRHHYNAR
jgi:biopolymer transport protein ExbB/TolQ